MPRGPVLTIGCLGPDSFSSPSREANRTEPITRGPSVTSWPYVTLLPSGAPSPSSAWKLPGLGLPPPWALSSPHVLTRFVTGRATPARLGHGEEGRRKLRTLGY